MDARDAVQDSTASVGIGNITLTNLPIAGRQRFSAVYPVGATGIPYRIEDQPLGLSLGANWEQGYGTLVSASVLSRDTVLASSNGGALVSFGLGLKNVFVTPPAAALGQVVPFVSTGIPLKGNQVMQQTFVTTALSLTVDTAGALPGNITVGSFIADGVSGHVPTFTNAAAASSDSGYLNTLNVENFLTLLKTHSQTLYSWLQNAAGTASATVAPNAPTIGTATGGNTSASVAFTPAGTGAAATSFVATSTPGGLTGTGATSPVTVNGLTNGTAYTFTVRAVNGAGSSPESAASNSVTPAAGIATVSGTAPAGTVGTAYTYTYTTTGFVGTITPSVASGTLPAGLALSVSGTNIILSGTPTTAASYTFVVRGTGATSGVADSPSQSVTVTAGLAGDAITLELRSAMTESTVTSYRNYTGPTGGTFSGSHGVSATPLLAASANGGIQQTVNAIVSGQDSAIGISTVATDHDFTTNTPLLLVKTSTQYTVYENGTLVFSSSTGSLAAAAGDLCQVVRTGSVWNARIQRGGSQLLNYASSYTGTGVVYPFATTNDIGSVQQLKKI